MATILILGNGISRLSFDAQIRAFTGEIWGCNRVYIDYGDILTALAGHSDVMREAEAWREKTGATFAILPDSRPYSCPEIYRKDTGTTLVAEALTRGHDVIVCGFDLGGLDVYSPDHEKKDKSVWVKRWRLILSEFWPDRVTFWGHDHKPFILSGRPEREYSARYMHGVPHIEGDGYDEALKSWGGDYSRIWDSVPLATFKNIGFREWTLAEIQGPFFSGREVIIPEYLARKYADFYPGEFEINPLRD